MKHTEPDLLSKDLVLRSKVYCYQHRSTKGSIHNQMQQQLAEQQTQQDSQTETPETDTSNSQRRSENAGVTSRRWPSSRDNNNRSTTAEVSSTSKTTVIIKHDSNRKTWKLSPKIWARRTWPKGKQPGHLLPLCPKRFLTCWQMGSSFLKRQFDVGMNTGLFSATSSLAAPAVPGRQEARQISLLNPKNVFQTQNFTDISVLQNH